MQNPPNPAAPGFRWTYGDLGCEAFTPQWWRRWGIRHRATYPELDTITLEWLAAKAAGGLGAGARGPEV